MSAATRLPASPGEGVGLAAHVDRCAAPAEYRSRAFFAWPRSCRPIVSSWPTRNITAGRGAAAARCCPADRSSSGRGRPCAPRVSGQKDGWKSSMSSPTTTAGTPNPAWVDGGAAAHRRAQRRCSALPPPHTLCRYLARACSRTPWNGSGRSPPSSNASAGQTGCQRRAEAATGARSTSAGAVAKRSSSPATPPAPIRCAICRRTTRSWPNRWRAANEEARPREAGLIPRPHPSRSVSGATGAVGGPAPSLCFDRRGPVNGETDDPVRDVET